MGRNALIELAPVPYGGQALDSDFVAFSSSCRHRIAVGASPTVDSTTASKITTWKAATTALGVPHYPTLSVSNYGHPVTIVNGSYCPRVNIPISGWAGPGKGPPWVDADEDAAADDVPCPEPSLVAIDGGGDKHATIVDLQNSKIWEFWNFVRVAENSYTAGMCAGWEIGGIGYNTDATYGPRNRAVAAGVAIHAGLLRYEEFVTGVIAHALNVTVPGAAVRDKFYSPPASNTDGTNTGTQYIEEGARIQLDPSLDLVARGLNSTAIIIATALQTYGAFVMDRSSACMGIKCQTYPGMTNPWLSVSPTPNLNLLSEDDFRFVLVDGATLYP